MTGPATPDAVRAAIARCGERADERRVIGRIALRPHQLVAVARLREMIARSGGALLADDTGLGKTYVAAALASEMRAPLIVAPAALLPMWEAALEAAVVSAPLLSFERLSRGAPPRTSHDLVIVDEAHHARTRATRRYRELSALTARASVLLLSATPIHNRRRDLETLLALFLGERASAMSDEELGRHILRRDRSSVDAAGRPPAAARPIWLPLPHDEALLAVLLSLPPPLPPADGGDGGALLVHSLVRQWASSDGALRGALERRAARAAALSHALLARRYPTRRELRDWATGDGALQLAFPELMASPCGDDHGELLEAVREHARMVDELRNALRSRVSLDALRAERLREVRRVHPGEKIVAFAAYAETAASLYRELRGDGHVAALSAHGARVAGGGLTRREAIERFAPVAQGVRPPRDAERIDVLIATDLLSEGMNLQDASVVVHLDLPWTPARMEQRVGRAARIGSAHDRVTVYALAPPASAERLIAVERRLREKLCVARRAIGADPDVLPLPLIAMADGAAPGEAADEIRVAFTRWRAASPGATDDGELVAAVHAPGPGFLAALESPDGALLLAATGSPGGGVPSASTDPSAIARAVRLAEGIPAQVNVVQLGEARAAIVHWVAERRAAVAAGAEAVSPIRRKIARRIGDIVARAAAHRRPLLASLAAEARAASRTSLGTGGEQELRGLLEAPLPDEAWLEAVAAFASARQRTVAPEAGIAPEEDAKVVALLLLQATGGGAS